MLTLEIREPRIERYFPDVLANAKEFKELGKVVDPELKAIFEALWRQMLNTFVYDIDETGAERWEDMLRITPPKGATLISRRREILKRLASHLPYTHRTFQDMLDAIYGEGECVVNLNYNGYELWIDITSNLITQVKQIKTYSRVIVPANLGIYVSRTINAELSQYAAAAVGFIHKTVIEAAGLVDLPDIDGGRYATAVVGWKHYLTIGGQ